MTITDKFFFRESRNEEFQEHIKSLNPKKATVENDIPTKMLITTNEITSGFTTKIYNDSKDDQIFPDSLKNGDVIPIHKKEEKTNKENYRPVSLLHAISKLFERDMYNQILSYIDMHLSPYLFGQKRP